MNSNSTLKILLLEDNPMDAELLMQHLKSKLQNNLDFKWVVYEDEFLKELAEYQPDIVLSDYNLPAFNGIQALKHTIAYNPLIPFIIVTGSLSEEIAADSIKAGAWDYVVKDRLHRLPTAIHNSLKLKEERKKLSLAEKKLKKSEERVRSMFERSLSGILYANVDGSIIEANPTLIELLGSPNIETTKQINLFRLPQLIESGFTANLKHCIDKKEPLVIESEYKTKWGKLLIVKYSLVPIESEGKVIGILANFDDVTQLRNTQKQLQKSKEEAEKNSAYYQTIFENTGTAACIFDQDTTLSLVNSKFENYIGYSKEELIGKRSWTEFVVKEDLERMVNYHQQRRDDDTTVPSQYEFSFINKNGDTIHTYLTIGLIPGTGKSVASLLDITERKRIEEELRLSEEKFRLISASAQDAIIMINNDGNVTYLNPSATKILGYTFEETIGRNFHDMVAPQEFRKLHNEAFAKFQKTGEGDAIGKLVELRAKHKNGTELPVELSLSKMKIDNKWGAVGILRDISERKKAEQELKESEHKLKTILNELQSGLLIIKEDTKEIIDLNPAGAKIIGLQPKETYNTICSDILSCGGTCPSLNLGETISEESLITTKNGNSIPILKTVSKIHINGENYLIENFIDISEQKQLTKDLSLALDKATESDRLKSAFLATMSHELRTPLNAVIGFSDLIMDGMDMEDVLEMSKLINENGNELLRIIESIFELSMIQSKESKVKMETVMFADLFASVKQALNARMIKEGKSNLRCIYKPDSQAKTAAIVTDKTKLLQILSIFASNAIKFTDQGSIEYGFQKNDQYIDFFVKDTGIGIPNKKQDIIFDKFRQVDDSHTRKHGGLGLGLAICKELSNILNGTLRVESEVGVGSTFYFRLPHTHNQAEMQKNEKLQKDTAIDLTGKTILIAEDMESNYLYLKKLLAKTNATIIWVQNGVDAVSQVGAHPEIELVLMDIRMPVMNGLEATQKIKENKPEIKIVAQTAYAMPKDEKLALEAGCDDYISKPIRSEKLYSSLNKIFT